MRGFLVIFYISTVVFCVDSFRSKFLHVKLPSGSELWGSHGFSLHGEDFRSFLGVPYAQPPVGPLRFKSPQPSIPWKGERDFITYASMCSQRNSFFRLYTVDGSEDCLYLNIFTPLVRKTIHKLPVLVYFHGGGFQMNSAENYLPQYFLDHQIVLITVNYRLGPLGFLSTGQEDCPGNNGLKDQQLALKWIQKNINAFGGNPNLVTIFGESAGGASVTYHMVSPLSKGLFHRGISQSGTYFGSWARPALGNIAPERAARMGEMMGCPKNGSDWKGMIDCLRTIDAEKITAAYYDFFKWDFDPMVPFPPVIEPNLPGAFLTEHLDNLSRPHGLSIPWIGGVNSAEGSLRSGPITNIKSVYESFLKNMNDLAFPVSLYYDHLSVEEQQKITKEIHSFYFNNEKFNLDKHLWNLTNLYSDNWFISGNDEYLNLRLNEKDAAPTYVYLVSHKSAVQFSTVFWGGDNKFYGGSCHADELQYMFPVKELLFPFAVPTEDDHRLREIVVQTWVHFAKTGTDPTGFSKNVITWEPATKFPLDYLRIGNLDTPESPLIGMERGLYDERLNFWRKIKQTIYKNNKTSEAGSPIDVQTIIITILTFMLIIKLLMP